MLDVCDVTVRYGDRTVLDQVSLSVARGAVVALLGPSGSGKTTLLRVIAGLLRPDAGRVSIDGRDVTNMAAHLRQVGLVFQDDQLFPHHDVAGNIAFGLRIAKWSRDQQRARVTELLELVGLPGFEHRRIAALSGGEARRVALARSLAPRPAVLLLDEPLSGLDPDLHDRLAVDLAALLRATGTTALMVTHDRSEAELVADRAVHLGEL
jgi:thiamine transport system ATP-binding protein